MIEPQIRALFKDMAGHEPPSSRVDTRLAHHRGRARLRWRRAGVAGTSVAAVAALVLTTSLAISGTVQRHPAAGPAAPRQFNPLRPYLSFGWLPKGESMVSGGTGKKVMYLTAAPSPNNLDATWDLSVYAAGVCKLAAKRLTCSPFGGLPLAEITGRAPAVHGHRAFWADVGLVWQYARGGWARLIFPYPFDFRRLPKTIKPGTVQPGTTRATVKRDAIKMASNLRYGAAAPPLKFPAQLTHLPGQWQVSGTSYVPYGSVLRVRTYALNAAPAAGERDFDAGLTFQGNLPYFEINPVTERHNPCFFFSGKNDSRKSARETINGYHVIVTHERGSAPRQDLCAANAGGLSVHIAVNGPHPVIGVASIFKDHLRLLGTNPANWTAMPIG